MFGLSGFELAVILLVAFLLFGPEKLPELAKILGKAIGKFREAQAEVNDVIKEQVGQEGVDFIQNPMASLEGLAKPEEERKAKKVETFAERKARYEAEREAKRKAAAEAAAKKAEEEQAALQAAAEAEAASAEAPAEAGTVSATEEKGE